ncbi:MAG TPA: hypothetical protein DCS93_19070 [Microscillaceae bacterium]|nr:hypothetical protein [Microscillaceae bacterium]
MKTLTQIITYLFLLWSVWGLSSCQEIGDDITIENPHSTIVIDALITDNPGPYFVQVSKTSDQITTGWVFGDGTTVLDTNYIPVTNATVILSDDKGNSEVLVPYNALYPNRDSQGRRLTFAAYGFYQTSGALQGTSGTTYTLTIQSEGKTYQASATLPDAPPSFQANYDTQKVLPLISFNESIAKEDHYIFFYDIIRDRRIPLNPIFTQGFTLNLWTQFTSQFTPIDGQTLSSSQENWDIYKQNYLKNPYDPDCNFCPDRVWIEMHKVSQEAYEFYQTLETHDSNMAGVFSPALATPPTNFDNGALGFFKAASVQRLVIPIKR